MITPRHRNNHRHFNATWAAAILLAPLFCLGVVAAEQNATAPEAVVPRSVFVVPTSAKEGRDPFYPKSNRVLGGGSAESLTTISATSLLVMNGLSGVPGHRTAMINGRTLAEGETSDIPTTAGYVKVRCVQIKEASVVIEVGGATQELFLRGSK